MELMIYVRAHYGVRLILLGTHSPTLVCSPHHHPLIQASFQISFLLLFKQQEADVKRSPTTLPFLRL